ncbi:hypothetical protein M758_1G260700 [Ceratodon purpureus]|nr:hypothetical protein M758_1G260700 [Ceratodon purpureus]
MMAMERDRGPRGDTSAATTSLWIDYLLLPEKLEEHLAGLAAGVLLTPSSAELITVFLEQALLSQKASLGYSLPAIAIAKDGLPSVPDAWTAVTKTAALLCERAARVAVSLNLTLEEMEASISSAQHQFMLLKALVKHDKPRLLIHECDLNRWMLRNALHSHPLGSAAPNASLSGPQAVVWTLGEEVGSAAVESVDNGCWSVSVSRNVSNGVVRGPLEEEKHAIEFLENVLSHRDGVCSKGASSACKLIGIIAQDGEDQGGGEKFEGTLSAFLSKGYWCRIMLDVAEVHFMRGRIHVAHELFTKCAELNQRISENDKNLSDGAFPQLRRLNNGDGRRSASSVPMQRLSGFIIACRMLLGLHPKSNGSEGSQRDLNEIVFKSSSLLSLGEPSVAQKMVIACERSRFNLKQNSEGAQSLVRRTPEDDDLTSHPPSKKLKSFHTSDLDMGANPESRVVDGVEGAKENVTTGLQGTECLAATSKIEESGCTKSESGVPGAGSDGLNVGEKTKSEVIESKEAIPEEVVVLVDMSSLPNDPIKPYKEKVLDSMGLSKSADAVSSAGSEQECIRLIRNVVVDTFEGHLKKGYRLSLARDSGIPASLHCQLVACNVVRDIVEGAPMQTFLQSSTVFRDSLEGVKFLMSLMAAVKKGFDESPKPFENGTTPKLPTTRRMYSRQGFERASIDVRSITDSSSPSAYISEFVVYVCCVLDRPWCWEAARKNNLISTAVIPKLFVSEDFVIGCETSTPEFLDGAAESGAASVRNISTGSLGNSEEFQVGRLLSSNVLMNFTAPSVEPSLGNQFELEVVLCALLTAEDIWDIEGLVSKVERLSESLKMKDNSNSTGTHLEVEHVKVDTEKTSLALDVAAVLRRRAFNALDITKQLWVARKLYELAKSVHSRDHDSMMMLWLLDKVGLKEGASVSLPGVEEFDQETSLDLGAVEYVLLTLIEKELWNDLTELCEWGLSIVKKGRSTGGVTRLEGSRKGQGIGINIWYRRCAQILKVATALAELMQLCTNLLQQTRYNEDVARISSKTSQLFEDFLCLLVGSDIEGSSSGAEDGNQSWGAQNRKVAPPTLNPSIRAIPLISQLTNSRVLTNLASLMAGWLQRCNIAGLIPWPLSIERYGALAAVTSGASLPPSLGSLPHGAGVFSPFPPRASPEFGRNLFGVLLERIVELPGAVERDKDKGHRWLQGLADLAFEDEAYVKALQLYLQAGGIKSAFYCDRSSAMTEEVFTQWVLRRMVQGCRAIGATVQAALLCQKLPGPDHESAFRILQENSLIVVRDAVAYFDCVWEVPLLELLVHMHAKSGDHERHTALIALLQQPALNAHNPQSVRVAHVASLEQRFLQRLCGELL